MTSLIVKPYNPKTPKRSPHIQNSVWNFYKDAITGWHGEGRDRKAIQRLLQDNYDFHPSMPQLTKQFKIWNLYVYLRPQNDQRTVSTTAAQVERHDITSDSSLLLKLSIQVTKDHGTALCEAAQPIELIDSLESLSGNPSSADWNTFTRAHTLLQPNAHLEKTMDQQNASTLHDCSTRNNRPSLLPIESVMNIEDAISPSHFPLPQHEHALERQEQMMSNLRSLCSVSGALVDEGLRIASFLSSDRFQAERSPSEMQSLHMYSGTYLALAKKMSMPLYIQECRPLAPTRCFSALSLYSNILLITNNVDMALRIREYLIYCAIAASRTSELKSVLPTHRYGVTSQDIEKWSKESFSATLGAPGCITEIMTEIQEFKSHSKFGCREEGLHHSSTTSNVPDLLMTELRVRVILLHLLCNSVEKGPDSSSHSSTSTLCLLIKILRYWTYSQFVLLEHVSGSQLTVGLSVEYTVQCSTYKLIDVFLFACMITAEHHILRTGVKPAAIRAFISKNLSNLIRTCQREPNLMDVPDESLFFGPLLRQQRKRGHRLEIPEYQIFSACHGVFSGELEHAQSFHLGLKPLLAQCDVLLAKHILQWKLSHRLSNKHPCADAFPVFNMIDEALILDIEGKHQAAVNAYARLEKVLRRTYSCQHSSSAIYEFPWANACLGTFVARKKALDREASERLRFCVLGIWDLGVQDDIQLDCEYSSSPDWQFLPENYYPLAMDVSPYVESSKRSRTPSSESLAHILPEEFLALISDDRNTTALIQLPVKATSDQTSESGDYADTRVAAHAADTVSLMSMSTRHSGLESILSPSDRSFQELAVRIRRSRAAPPSISSGHMSIDTRSSWSFTRVAGYPYSATASIRSSE